MGFDKQAFISVISGTISSLALNILLVKSHGAFGASIASVMSEIVVLIVAIVFVLKLMTVQLNVKSIFHPIFASLPIIPISLWFNFIENSLYYILITIFTSVTFYLIMMVFVFKNGQANQILYHMKNKIINNYKKIEK
jgi:O-antigen/teichoic acid export membrane protein